MQRFNKDNSIQAIVSGVQAFQEHVYPEKQELFKALAKKQEPKILFITCSDSRIDPSLITQTDPGSLFLVQNAGNIIPPYGTPYGGTGASIEYAITVLNVEHIIVCGHSSCGAMGALLDDNTLAKVTPSIKQWITYADSTRAIVEAEGANLNNDARLDLCIARNVQVQIRHLKTFPSVAARMASGNLSVHGWVYHIESGEIDVYDREKEEFVSFADAYAQKAGAAVG